MNTTPLRIEDEKSAQKALERIVRLAKRLKDMEKEAEEQRSLIEQRLGKQVRPLLEEYQQLERGLEVFLRETGMRCLKLRCGKIGLRRSAKLAISRPEVTLRRLIQHGLGDCIRVKQEIDRQSLRKLDGRTLRSLGVKKEARDKFYVRLTKQ